MEPVTSKLKRTRLFAQLPDEAIADLIAVPGVERAPPAISSSREPGDLVVLLEGGLAMRQQRRPASTSPPSASTMTRPIRPSSTPSPRRRACNSAALRLCAHRRPAARRHAVRQARGQEPRRARRGRARAHRQPDERRSSSSSMPFEHWCAAPRPCRKPRWRPARSRRSRATRATSSTSSRPGRRRCCAPIPASEAVKVATLGPGASFGEEALLKGEPRNATVRMTDAGRVLKIGKEDFDRLLKSRAVARDHAGRGPPQRRFPAGPRSSTAATRRNGSCGA